MPHAMYFSSNKETITKINQVPYQVIEYDDKGMFQAKLMDNTQVEIFIDNGATPSILPMNIYNKYPILQKCPEMESHTPIYTGGGMIDDGSVSQSYCLCVFLSVVSLTEANKASFWCFNVGVTAVAGIYSLYYFVRVLAWMRFDYLMISICNKVLSELYCSYW